jgi:hypothetical protein
MEHKEKGTGSVIDKKQRIARVRPATKALVTRAKLGNETFDDTVRRIVSGFPELVDHIADLIIYDRRYNRHLIENDPTTTGEVAQSQEPNAKKLKAVNIREIDIGRLSDYATKDGESPASILNRVLSEYALLNEAFSEVGRIHRLREDELREKNTEINRLTNRLDQIDKMFEEAGYRPTGETSRPQEYERIVIMAVEQS